MVVGAADRAGPAGQVDHTLNLDARTVFAGVPARAVVVSCASTSTVHTRIVLTIDARGTLTIIAMR